MIKNVVKKSVVECAEKMPPMPLVEKRIVENPICLNANENQYGTSKKALEAMENAIKCVNTYPSPMASELIAKLAEYHSVNKDEIIAANGSSTILELIGDTFIEPGDEIVTCIPTFMIYIMIINARQGKPVICPLTEDLKFDLNAMKKAITEKTKMVWICNPNNPTGTAVDSNELEDFIMGLPDSVVTVIDEAYIDFSDDSVKTMLPLINKKNIIITRTFSKIYGLAGTRVGYAIANAEIIKYIRSVIMMFNVNKIGIAGAIAALDDREFYDKCKALHKKGREYIASGCTKLGFKVYESQTSFVYMDPPVNMEAMKINAALAENGIYVNANPKGIRISVGTEEQNRRVIACLEKILKS